MYLLLKPSQNKKGKKNPFLQLAAEKKDSKNGATRKIFVPTLSRVSVQHYLQ